MSKAHWYDRTREEDDVYGKLIEAGIDFDDFFLKKTVGNEYEAMIKLPRKGFDIGIKGSAEEVRNDFSDVVLPRTGWDYEITSSEFRKRSKQSLYDFLIITFKIKR